MTLQSFPWPIWTFIKVTEQQPNSLELGAGALLRTLFVSAAPPSYYISNKVQIAKRNFNRELTRRYFIRFMHAIFGTDGSKSVDFRTTLCGNFLNFFGCEFCSAILLINRADRTWNGTLLFITVVWQFRYSDPKSKNGIPHFRYYIKLLISRIMWQASGKLS